MKIIVESRIANVARALFATMLFASFAPQTQAADITGDTVNVTHFFPDSSSVNLDMGNQVVPTGSFNYYGIYDVVVSGTFMTVDVHCGTGCSWSDASFNGMVLTNLTSSSFSGVSIDGSTNYAGFDLSRLSFDANHVYVNLQGLDANGYLQVDFTTPVPEPETYAMLLAGLGLLGFAARRRKQQAA